MPESIIFSGAQNSEHNVLKPTSTFTGEVYLDLISMDSNAALANVTFTPCARTNWHTHEGGQMIHVSSGTGWICDKGGVARRIKAGDVIWAPAGTTHWHGADNNSIMTHFVVGIGETKWHDKVTDEEYNKRAQN
ncbi:cupin domain-containing protein [Aspergillus novofumigatus IBT 16806]|uniref:RmlC-like cupin n=1 Tax=Aspergillus novofumigatus (strain IBT 16806) TaxID=1392255 RepID=A0A2I1CH16_ASPN1|nr:RmlC-like cupin [Aspergillus novofumigatus IBT 16806]PKX96918.1 RmlC-like cupin [Aspergillus novofumigatus IBT 16806]